MRLINITHENAVKSVHLNGLLGELSQRYPQHALRDNYSSKELDLFLDALENLLPISSTAWGRVAKIHMARYLDKAPTVDSLKSKIKELHSKRVPVEDPLCPPVVCCAKQIRRSIIDKINGTSLNAEEGNGDGDEELVLLSLNESENDDNLVNANEDDDDGSLGLVMRRLMPWKSG